MVKNTPANAGDMVWPLGREDPLEKEMATHARYSCLENPMDRGAWWATLQGVVKGSDIDLATKQHNN